MVPNSFHRIVIRKTYFHKNHSKSVAQKANFSLWLVFFLSCGDILLTLSKTIRKVFIFSTRTPAKIFTKISIKASRYLNFQKSLPIQNHSFFYSCNIFYVWLLRDFYLWNFDRKFSSNKRQLTRLKKSFSKIRKIIKPNFKK